MLKKWQMKQYGKSNISPHLKSAAVASCMTFDRLVFDKIDLSSSSSDLNLSSSAVATEAAANNSDEDDDHHVNKALLNRLLADRN